jgi:hypothetical protein
MATERRASLPIHRSAWKEHSYNFVLKLSEKSHRCPKRGPKGRRSGRSGPSVATKSPFQALHEPLFRRFLYGVLRSSRV